MIKNYHIKFDWWEASIQIDDSPATIEAMKEQLLFWTGGQTLIDDYDGDVTHAYIRQTAPIIIDLSRNKNTYGIIHELKNMEGFLPIDGSIGIKLVESESWEFAYDDFEVQELKHI
jgi:hypothetical protein